MKRGLSYRSEDWAQGPELEVHDIFMLPIPDSLLRRYDSERERLDKREALAEVPVPSPGLMRPISGRDQNEVFPFHGTPLETIEPICKDGFDCKHAGRQTGSMFGRGFYFAPNASKCDQCSTMDENGRKRMILVRVWLGACLPKWRQCGDIETLGKFDSIVAVPKACEGSVDFREFCIYQNT